MVTVVITVIVMLILVSIFVGDSLSSIDQASETKIKQELSEVKKGVRSARLINAKDGTDEETLNRGFIKAKIENAPIDFVSFDTDEITGYVVDLSTINYEKLKSGRDYLTLMKGDVITFDVDDVFVYDSTGKVYYAKGYQLEEGEIAYNDAPIEVKEGPTIQIISTEKGNVKIKVTPRYGGEITEVKVGSKIANKTDGENFEVTLTSNGSYIVMATEEGGNSTRTTLTVTDITEEESARPEILDVYINNHSLYTNKQIVTLIVEAENATKMSISQDGLEIPSVNDIAKWRNYARESTIKLAQGENKIYVWVKNDDNVSSEYKLTEIILDSIAPTSEAPSWIMDGYKLLLTCNQTDENEITKIEYGYKKTTEPEYKWQDSQIVVDIEPGAKYNIMTKATDIAGNTSESRATETEEILSIPDVKRIEVEPESGWTDKVAVAIEYPDTYGVDPYENLYRINGGEWQQATSNNVALSIIANAKIEAVVAVKINGIDTRMGNIKEYDVENIDRIKPLIYDISETAGQVQEGYDISFKIIDEESGLVAWNMTTSDEVPEEWAETFGATNEPIERTQRIERSGTYYIWAKDERGLVASSMLKIDNIDITDPIINSYRVSYDVGKATIIVKAIDAELGLVAYAFTRGENSEPVEADWVEIERTTIEHTITHEVTENDYYTVWVKDISGRTSHMQQYVKVVYTVTYDYKSNQGETISLNGTNILYVGCNSEVDLTPRATRQYSNFEGWNTNVNAKTALNTLKIGDASTGQEDIRIYAIFKYIDTITFKKSSEVLVPELTVTIEKSTPFTTLQYSNNGTSWTNYTQALILRKNATLYARTMYSGEVIKTDSLAITNICSDHNFSDATCFEARKCSYCGLQDGVPLQHEMGEWTDTDTRINKCIQDNLQRRICTNGCGTTEERTEPATGHSYGAYETTKEATCTEEGTQRSICKSCGTARTRTIEKKEHTIGEWYTTKEATCTATGIQRRKCSKCSYYETKTIPALNHNYGSWTSKDDYDHEKKCSRCSDTVTQAHTFAIVNDLRACSVCGFTKNQIYVTLYTDGTLGFSNDESTIAGKTVQALYGNIANDEYISETLVPWNANKTSINTAIFVNKITPTKSTAHWFNGCSNLKTVENISNLNTANVKNMSYMFAYTGITSLDLSSFNTSNVTNMGYMFANSYSISSVNVSSFDTSKVTNMSGMFRTMMGLTSLNVSNFNTQNVITMDKMFLCCTKLTSLNISNFDTRNVTTMDSMFAMSTGLQTITIDNTKFVTSKVTTFHEMFGLCNALKNFDVSKFDTRNATSMGGMFLDCRNLQAINVSNFNTSNVTDMVAMFYGCSTITTLDISKFDTSKVTRMDEMFNNCSSLSSIDVSSFNTSIVTNMTDMFNGCSSITSLDLSKFDTSKVQDMSGMFANCSSLKTINLSSFNTSSIIDMRTKGYSTPGGFTSMFYNCRSLTSLDLTNFNTATVVGMDEMFASCSSLATIILGTSFNKMNGTNMFSNCTSLIDITTNRAITSSSDAIKLGTNINMPSKTFLYVPDRTSEINYEAATNYETVFGAKNANGDIVRVRVKGDIYVEPKIAFANTVGYEFESFSITSSGSNYVTFNCHSWGGYEKINIPINNLKAGLKYTITFTEQVSDQEFIGDYSFGCKVSASKIGETGEEIPGLVYRQSSPSPSGRNGTITFTATASTMYWVWDFSEFENNHYSTVSIKNVVIQ